MPVVQVQHGADAGTVLDCLPPVPAPVNLPQGTGVVFCGNCLTTGVAAEVGYACVGCGALVIDLEGPAWAIVAGLKQPAPLPEP